VAGAQTAGFVTRVGTNLKVGGQPWQFIGYNLPCTAPFQLPADQQAYFFQSIAANSGANALRVWMFQSNGGPSNWAPFDQMIASAKAAGLRIIPTLVNEWNTCESPTATGQRKTLPWYQAGYKQTGDGYPLSFKDFATQVAGHYANEPAIAFWQLVNEAEAPTLNPNNQWSCSETVASQALRSFGDDMATALHNADHNHLVSLGTIGGDQCGLVGSDFPYVHQGSVDLCEYHDYGDPFNTLDQDLVDGLNTRLHQCQALPGGGKPLFVGESGLVANVQATPPEPASCAQWPNCTPPVTFDTLNRRATLFQGKIKDAFAAGIAGYQIWFKQNYYSAQNDPMAIGSGDPTETMLASTKFPSPPPGGPPATVPETSRTVLLPISALVALGLAGTFVWLRPRRRRARSPS
jgi:mannan endo-1,4-beta-mannosidase